MKPLGRIDFLDKATDKMEDKLLENGVSDYFTILWNVSENKKKLKVWLDTPEGGSFKYDFTGVYKEYKDHQKSIDESCLDQYLDRCVDISFNKAVQDYMIDWVRRENPELSFYGPFINDLVLKNKIYPRLCTQAIKNMLNTSSELDAPVVMPLTFLPYKDNPQDVEICFVETVYPYHARMDFETIKEVDRRNTASQIVTNRTLSRLNVTKEELYDIAMENLRDKIVLSQNVKIPFIHYPEQNAPLTVTDSISGATAALLVSTNEYNQIMGVDESKHNDNLIVFITAESAIVERTEKSQTKSIADAYLATYNAIEQDLDDTQKLPNGPVIIIDPIEEAYELSAPESERSNQNDLEQDEFENNFEEALDPRAYE